MNLLNITYGEIEKQCLEYRLVVYATPGQTMIEI